MQQTGFVHEVNVGQWGIIIIKYRMGFAHTAGKGTSCWNWLSSQSFCASIMTDWFISRFFLAIMHDYFHWLCRMGGHSDLSLSSHTRDDQQYNAKRDELRQYIPDLEHHLRTLSIIIFSLFFPNIVYHSKVHFKRIKRQHMAAMRPVFNIEGVAPDFNLYQASTLPRLAWRWRSFKTRSAQSTKANR